MFDIIFGIPNENDDYMFNVFNYIILLAKNFVYNCRINDSDICFKKYKSKLFVRLQIEKYIATSQNKIEDYNKAWKGIVDNLTSI